LEKVMALTFRQVRYFIATAEVGKISLAAANLNVSQSAITSAVKALEEELGTQLFQRKSNGVILTYEGHQFLQHAHNIVAAVSEATRSPRRTGENVTGAIEVGVTYTVAGYFLPPILARFMRAFPSVTVNLHERERERVEQEIISNRLDVAVLLVSNLHNEAEIDAEVLIRSRRRLWACPDHHLISRDEVTLEDVSHEPYVMLTVDEANLTALRYWTGTPYRPRIVFSTSSVEAVRSMVATDMGVTILSDMVYRPWSLEGQRIDVKPLTDGVPSMDVGLAWRRGAELSSAAAVFQEYLRLAFSGSAPSYLA
jgi:DNA-binding transcriptional LysR family regulator